MTSPAVLGRYANALADVVWEANLEPVVTVDLQTYAEIFRTVPDLLEALHAPSLPRDAKEKLLAEIMERYPVNRVTSNFLRVLLRRGRIRFFQTVFESYLRLMRERKGIRTATVTAARPLSPQEVERLGAKLAEMAGGQVTMEFRTDADLLGGVIVQMGSTVYDGSVRSRLAELRRRLAET